MQKVSKGFYLGSIAGAGGLGLLLTIIGNLIMLSQGPDSGEAAIFLVPGILLSIYAGVIGMVLWYKAWSAIQDGNARTTPAKAIGFLFIPIYGFYWVFQAYLGFAKDYNAYLKRHSVSAQDLPEGLFLTTCILTVVGIFTAFIPVFSSLFSLVSYTIWIMVIIKVCDALNSIVAVAETNTVKKTESTETSKETKTSGMAITSLVLSCSGILIGIFGAIPGLILGIVSLGKINKSEGKLSGRGLAIAGISVGGFMTLVGLIVLAAIIPAMSISRVASKNAATMANMHAIDTAVMVYVLDKGNLPQDISALTPEYLEQIPVDSWGNCYVYTVNGADDFDIYSLGPDGIAGTTDDIYLAE
jgi:hypothetical protein